MSETTTSAQHPVELDHRANDGVEVSLLWHKPNDRLTVFLHDTRSGEQFELDVAGDYALDAFQHPYAYAYSRGLVHPEPVHA